MAPIPSIEDRTSQYALNSNTSQARVHGATNAPQSGSVTSPQVPSPIAFGSRSDFPMDAPRRRARIVMRLPSMHGQCHVASVRTYGWAFLFLADLSVAASNRDQWRLWPSAPFPNRYFSGRP